MQQKRRYHQSELSPEIRGRNARLQTGNQGVRRIAAVGHQYDYLAFRLLYCKTPCLCIILFYRDGGCDAVRHRFHQLFRCNFCESVGFQSRNPVGAGRFRAVADPDRTAEFHCNFLKQQRHEGSASVPLFSRNDDQTVPFCNESVDRCCRLPGQRQLIE